MTVPARVSLLTLGVADVARSTAFYEALGWRRCFPIDGAGHAALPDAR